MKITMKVMNLVYLYKNFIKTLTLTITLALITNLKLAIQRINY